MELDHDACYRALTTRDARFDGRIFIAVHTTGVYCRPICAARTPKRENVTFYPTASAAQEAGFRPCLRCRPESSPDLAAWRGTSNTVSRALALIAEGALDGAGVFDADTILAKHDETYMPKEVADALKKSGHWKDDYAQRAAMPVGASK